MTVIRAERIGLGLEGEAYINFRLGSDPRYYLLRLPAAVLSRHQDRSDIELAQAAVDSPHAKAWISTL